MPLQFTLFDHAFEITSAMLSAAGFVSFLLICLFYLVGGPPRPFYKKFIDLVQALLAIALFFACIAASYKIGQNTGIGQVSLFGGLVAFWLLLSLYNYLRTPKHLRSKKFR